MVESHGISWAWWVLAWIGTALAVWGLYRLLRGPSRPPAPSEDENKL
ncbi:hypothetical protein SAMN05443662_1293 [Sulfurivirga caldicuralii]|uniref:Uncharacterized protein n=1 Tax=Sulfurivirga caldicuralii TaxID=364032 RepID=A0A1N6GDD0_9GAMM|nr:hypothetical protein [Sulfurivirga caldicuralii]SIO05477.1 hypothetical protein SAMN05443662_1293 [Sulfurivirga caldicuralii]